MRHVLILALLLTGCEGDPCREFLDLDRAEVVLAPDGTLPSEEIRWSYVHRGPGCLSI